MVVATPSGRRVLKCYRPQWPAATVRYGHSILEHLEARAVPAVRLARTPSGATFVLRDDRVFALFEFVAGVNYSLNFLRRRDRLRLTVMAAETLARLHRSTVGFVPTGQHHLGFVSLTGPRARDGAWHAATIEALERRSAEVTDTDAARPRSGAAPARRTALRRLRRARSRPRRRGPSPARDPRRLRTAQPAVPARRVTGAAGPRRLRGRAARLAHRRPRLGARQISVPRRPLRPRVDAHVHGGVHRGVPADGRRSPAVAGRLALPQAAGRGPVLEVVLRHRRPGSEAGVGVGRDRPGAVGTRSARPRDSARAHGPDDDRPRAGHGAPGHAEPGDRRRAGELAHDGALPPRGRLPDRRLHVRRRSVAARHRSARRPGRGAPRPEARGAGAAHVRVGDVASSTADAGAHRAAGRGCGADPRARDAGLLGRDAGAGPSVGPSVLTPRPISHRVQVWWTIENVRFMVRSEHMGRHGRWLLRPKRAAHRMLYNAGARVVDGIIVVSDETERSFRESVGYTGDKIHVVANAADMERFVPMRDRGSVRSGARTRGKRSRDDDGRHVQTPEGSRRADHRPRSGRGRPPGAARVARRRRGARTGEFATRLRPPG